MQKSVASAIFAVMLAAMMPASAQGPVDGNTPADRHKAGHSKLGEAFDEGPRERPSKMEGIGRSHFPITTSNPEVQQWFDQGHTLIHSFWFFEAERAFRWAVKLDPEAPMPYWGLARATSGQRAAAFMKEASKRKAKGTERERDYIEAWELMYGVPGVPSDRNKFLRAVERLIIKYPDDVEAKALYTEATMGNNRVGTEAVIKQILAADKDHPGGHHYRIHNWDDEDGAQALESCRRYGDLAPGIGHALHMPGHIYAGLGMYHEAAISLDAATRAEIAYMGRHMVFPYNTWNYAHNRNYLSYVQEQLGLPSEAIRGARELLAVPLDPKLNDATRFSPHWQGISALTRALVKFERWNEILAPNSIPWGTSLRDKLLRSYAEALAKLATESPEAAAAVAEHEALKREIDKPENSSYRTQFEVQSLELRATDAFAKGNAIDGLMLLTQAAPKELELRASYDDPPFYPTVMYSKLGHAYLKQSSPKLAVEAFEKALKAVRNDPFALAGLARARYASGDTAGATEALGQLLHLWQEAEPGLRWLQEAKATGIKATPTDRSAGPQRNYRTMGLDKYGPAIWKPFAAPTLSTRDHTGAPVSLDQFRGKNVVLVFYLGVGCAHCVQQLKDLNERAERFKAVDAEVIAVSADRPESNAKSQGSFTLRLLADDKFVNARRFKSYDDFEEMAIHSTILIDKEGHVHWARHGGGPFTDYDFLLKQLQRMNEPKGAVSTTSSSGQR